MESKESWDDLKRTWQFTINSALCQQSSQSLTVVPLRRGTINIF